MTIVLLILLVISIGLNIMFGWYAYKLVKRFVLVQETFEIFDDQMSEFSDHLKKIYEFKFIAKNGKIDEKKFAFSLR